MATPPCGCGRPVGPTTIGAQALSFKGETRRRRSRPRTNSKDEQRGRGGQDVREPATEKEKAHVATEAAMFSSNFWNRGGKVIRGTRRTSGIIGPGSTGSEKERTIFSKSGEKSGGGGDGGGLPRFALLLLAYLKARGRACAGGNSASAVAALLSWRATAVTMGLLAVASAQEGGAGAMDTGAAAGVTVPLTPAGLQYTADVTVSSGNLSWTAALIVDTNLSMLAFPACANNTESAEGAAADEEGEENDGTACIPYEDAVEDIKRLSCREWTVDGGTVTLHPDTPSGTQFLVYLKDQEVSLSTNLTALGEVVATSNTTVSDDSVTLDGWDGAAGVLGLARFPHRTCMQDGTDVDSSNRSVFSAMDGADTVFALDLRNESYNSTLEIGGYSEHIGDIHWGEILTAAFPSSWGFSAFGLSICGRSLMSNITTFWPAVLSTGSACLGLPEEFFDSLMAWLPVEEDCPPEESAMCYMSAENAAKELPSLSFRLSQYGQEFYLPLSSLLLDGEEEGEEGEETIDPEETPSSSNTNSTGGNRRLCVTRQPSIYESDSVFQQPSAQPMMSLGTLPLRSLYAVVDSEHRRVGLAQKAQDFGDSASPLDGGDNASCQTAKVCVGMQSYKESINACEDPSCSSYYLTILDEETKTCTPTGIMTILAWVFGIFFGITEMAGHFLRVYYGATGVGLRGYQHHQGWEFHTGRLIEAFLVKATRSAGLSRTPHERND